MFSAVAYGFHDQLVHYVLSPIGDQKLVYLTPAGGFTFIFQIVMYAGMLMSMPLVIYHLYRFIAPALPKRMHRLGIKIVAASAVLMTIGAGFGYYYAVPAALQFLTAFAGDFVTANLTADSYLNFMVAYVLGLGLLFQLPLLLILWNLARPIKPGGLLSSQRFVLVGAFVAAALITPTPDVFNQCLIALPIVGAYQFGVVSVYLTNRRRRMADKPVKVAKVVKAPKVLRRSDKQTKAAPRSQPRTVLANNFTTAVAPPAITPLAKTVGQQPKHVVEPPAKIVPLAASAKIDGLSRHSVRVGVPHRQVAYTRPSAASSRTAQKVTASSSATATKGTVSIDGFSFA
jgi:sec-independent protein translocase protein TatC